MRREARWHQTVKEVLQEVGENRGYDVSQSEQEMHFAKRFAMYDEEKRQVHTLTYKPDVVWKKDNKYRAIFEIEYLNPKSNLQVMEKRKYALGSLWLALISAEEKLCDNLVFVTNNESLCNEIAKSIELSKNFVKNLDKVWYLFNESTNRARLKKELQEDLVKKWRI